MACRSGRAGRRACSTARPGKPATWGRGQQDRSAADGEGDTLVNTVSHGPSTPRRLGRGYFGCKPSCTVGRWPIPAAVSMMCSTWSMTRFLRCSVGPGADQHRRPHCRGRSDRTAVDHLGPGSEHACRSSRSGEDRRVCSGLVRQSIPKANGKVRWLGIPTMADRVVQASLKLVLEPIFEADFNHPRMVWWPRRRAHRMRSRRFTTRLGHPGLRVGVRG